MLVPNEQDKNGAPLLKVIDFGLAKADAGENVESGLTHTGLTGALGFASPEQSQEGAPSRIRAPTFTR